MTKRELYGKFEKELDAESIENLLNMLFDFCSIDQLKDFLAHIKSEKGEEEQEDDELIED